MRKFLTAKWIDLVMANYEVEPKILERRVPYGTELDLNDSRCFASLVGFMFVDTRVMGMPIPFHINFEEVNLRFYVKRETAGELRRGVVFVKEIVPRYAIVAVARGLYSEPYECWRTANERDGTSVAYSWSHADCVNRISVTRGASLGVPEANSHGEFIIEHYWGYTRRTGGRTDEYKVEHPKWELFDAKEPVIEVDFGKTYGDEFAFLTGQRPYSVLLAKGSEISVYKSKSLK